MSKAYEIRRARREAERQRNLAGETLEQFHARENPARTKPGTGLPHVRCNRTPYLFGWNAERRDADDPQDLPQKGTLL